MGSKHTIKILNYVLWLALFNLFESCTYESLNIREDESGYPAEISNIILSKCAIGGCHTNESKDGASGLSLTTWDKMFEGNRGGAVVIPYRPEFSTLLFFTNTDTLQGQVLSPTMPINAPPLSNDEYLQLRNWLAQGAPDKNGFIKFSDNPTRNKFYLINRAADLVTVFDVESGLQMRCIDVGQSSAIESPHMVKVSPDNKFWYVIFFGSTIIQKFSTADNSFVSQLDLGFDSWTSIAISSDSKNGYVVGGNSMGRIIRIDLETMSIIQEYDGYEVLQGCALNQNEDTLYSTPRFGNYIYKTPANSLQTYLTVSIEPPQLPSTIPSLDPHEIIFSTDYSRYYVTCQRSNELRVLSTSQDTLITIIQTGKYPNEIGMSSTHPYLFVTCMSEVNIGTSLIGIVNIIDMNTNSIIKSVVPGHQPHGIAVDDQTNKVFIANRNTINGGPPPHHGNTFGVPNGYVTAIDMSTLELLPNYKIEVSVDPYSIGKTH